MNLCLSVLTLGIYSPWAKVRTRRYLYSHLVLDGSPFNYTADPLRILVGRLISVTALGLYSLAGALSPAAGGIAGLALLAATPWVVVRSTSFHRRCSEYRNVAFAFDAPYGEALKVFVVFPLLTLFTLGLAIPWLSGRQQQFFVEHSRFGTSPFRFSWQPGAYYRVFLRALGAVVTAFALASLAAFVSRAILADNESAQGVAGLAAVTSFTVAGYLLALALVKAGITNLQYENASLAGHRFASGLTPVRLAWLYLSNGLAIALSFGLLIPWAQVRMLRYRAENLATLADGDLEDFEAGTRQRSETGELASEGAEAFGFDFDFGL